jgi:hypothetical protein
VKHSSFKDEFNLKRLKELSSGERQVVIDIKAMLDREEAIRAGFAYWRL